jgi:SAM-dependent methyltransferase
MIPSEFQAMVANDERHWWYRGRRQVARAALDRLELPPAARLLDAGCGSGRMLDELRDYGDPVGLDIEELAVSAAHDRGHAARRGSIEASPFADDTFDLVTCLDVIEHTPDDRRTLRALRRVTRPGGLLLVTVPAYQALWSAHDEANEHYRRYSAGSLRAAAAAAGWTLVRDSYFNSILLAPAAAVRVARRLVPPASGASDLQLTPGPLNAVLERPMRWEAALIRRGVRLPAGLSLLAVFRAPLVDVQAPVLEQVPPLRSPAARRREVVALQEAQRLASG